jgi:hypothetical protein
MNSKLLLGVFITNLLISCSGSKIVDQNNVLSADTIGKVLKSASVKSPPLVNDTTFLALFPEISINKVHVYSPNEKTDGNKFQGKPIDSAFYKYFLFDDYLQSWLNNAYYHLFSCYKFKLSSIRTGLIVRAPSQYDETAISLYIWDNKARKIVKRLDLADSFGDAEWHFVKDAWLLDINKDGRPDFITRRKDWWRDDVDKGYGKLHITDSINLFTAVGDNFRKTRIKVDTAKFKLLDWP